MGDAIYLVTIILMFGLAIVAIFFFGYKRRARITVGAWFLLIGIGVAFGVYGMSWSTVPSTAPQVTVTGTSSVFTERRSGRDSVFIFTFIPEGKSPINLKTQIIVPGWGNNLSFEGRALRVTYLNDPNERPAKEAISITILSGDNAGWSNSLDARFFGA